MREATRRSWRAKRGGGEPARKYLSRSFAAHACDPCMAKRRACSQANSDGENLSQPKFCSVELFVPDHMKAVRADMIESNFVRIIIFFSNVLHLVEKNLTC